jgi:hypothetical protein
MGAGGFQVAGLKCYVNWGNEKSNITEEVLVEFVISRHKKSGCFHTRLGY